MEEEEKTIVKIIIWSIVGVFGIILLFSTFYVINAGERGIIVTFGNPSPVPTSEGLHVKIPLIQGIVKMDVKTQKYEAELTSASRDLQDVKTKIAINYHIVPENVPELYKTIGINYADKIIYPFEQETNKAVTSQYTAEELITKRETVRGNMKSALAEKLITRGIVVEEISIVDFAFSPSFTKAIEDKVTAEQQALQSKNKLEQIKFEAQQIIESAKGKAEAIELEGTAIRNNPQVAQLRAIEKWDGKMPLVVGGAVPFVSLDKFILQTAMQNTTQNSTS